MNEELHRNGVFAKLVDKPGSDAMIRTESAATVETECQKIETATTIIAGLQANVLTSKGDAH